jgi:hypothetical protein
VSLLPSLCNKAGTVSWQWLIKAGAEFVDIHMLLEHMYLSNTKIYMHVSDDISFSS